VDELRAQAQRVLRRAHEDGKTRRAFRRGLEQVIRDEWTAPAALEEDGFFVFSDGGAAGGSVLSDVMRRGVILGMSRGDRGAAQFDLVVPDGVARVRLTFRGGRTRTGAVRDNVVSLRVRIGRALPLPRRMVWLAADGSRIRTVRFP
jgi:hypothetical protein